MKQKKEKKMSSNKIADLIEQIEYVFFDESYEGDDDSERMASLRELAFRLADLTRPKEIK
jgi:hypothetical protein